ncbi:MULTISPECIES: ribonuclease E/G [unclassified Bradyrhizobium]|uniref:ribonuclease E/G n=2 Tax=Bradyrhizobium TaxID=374 RepID=UPI0035C6BA29
MELMVSKRIPSVEDRLRMAQLALEVPAGMGVFVRSSAKGIPDSEIIDEFDGLVRIWRAARDKTLRSQAPALIYDAPKRIVPPD